MSLVEESLNQSFSLGSSLATFLVGILGILIIYHLWFESLKSTKLGNKLPPLNYISLPIIGHAYIVINKSPSEILKLALHQVTKHGRLFRLWFANRLVVVLMDPRDVEVVLGSPKHLEKSTEYRFFEPWLGDGLLISNGEKWSSHRKMIAPTFHQSILKTFMPVFNKNADDLVNLLKKEVVGKVCDIHHYMSGSTVDVLLETVMGVKKSGEAKSSFKYAQAVMDMCAVLHYRHIRLWMRLDFIFRFTKLFKKQLSYLNIIHSLTDRVIKDKKVLYFERQRKGDISLYPHAVHETEKEILAAQNTTGFNFGSGLRDDLDENDENNVGEKKRLAFLDFMVEAGQTDGNKLSDTEIREEVNTIMFEGHDTTAAASSFFICMLGVYQDIQERVYQEMKEIFQDSDREVTFMDTLEMKYLERVLLETLRLYPPVPVITRVIREDIKLETGDYIIPANTTIAIPQIAIHRNPDHFPNPLKFDPDNFLPENCQKRHYYSFIPFSAGPRSCVGRKYAILKLKVLLSSVVRNFKIKSAVPEEAFQLQADIILKRTDGFQVILESRK